MRPATVGDVVEIIAHLSDQCRSEMEFAGWSEDTLALRTAAFMAKADESQILWFDDKPQALLSFGYDDQYLTVTWFLATKEYFSRKEYAVAHAREFIQDAAKRFGVVTTFNFSDDPKVKGWFKTLGYTEIQPGIFQISGLRT